jgi:hypothetical protein
MANPVDNAGRVIAGLLTYNPGPGIYSRLERAIEAMPENVRAQELPGLLKRYKDGVPGWELKATDLDSVIAGRDVVPKSELLARVQERSPVYTTRELRLEAPKPRHIPDEIRNPALQVMRENDYLGFDTLGQGMAAVREHPDWRNRWEVSDDDAGPLEAYRNWYANPGADYAGREIRGLGATEAHGPTRFHDYAGHGAKDYTELVFMQPNFGRTPGHHWHPDYPKPWDASPQVQQVAGRDAVSHMRMATHGDALRLLESQSDVLNDAIKAEESGRPAPARYDMQQAQVELDIKRLALEAARSGKRAIEIASPEAIARSVGMPLEHAQHRYGKVIPSELERLGRKMGGLVDDTPANAGEVIRYELPYDGGNLVAEPRHFAEKIFKDEFPRTGPAPAFEIDPTQAYNRLEYSYSLHPDQTKDAAGVLHAALAVRLQRAGMSAADASVAAGKRMPELMRLAEEQSARANAYDRVYELRDAQDAAGKMAERRGVPGKRYIMSDEMRRRLIESGVGASVLAPLLMQEGE